MLSELGTIICGEEENRFFKSKLIFHLDLKLLLSLKGLENSAGR